MTVQDTIDLGDGHLLEIGTSSEHDSQTSIRNYHPSSAGISDGQIPPEIPLTDLCSIVTTVAQRDLLDIPTTRKLVEALTNSLARRNAVRVIPSLQDLLDQVTDGNIHPETKTGPAVGNEIW